MPERRHPLALIAGAKEMLTAAADTYRLCIAHGLPLDEPRVLLEQAGQLQAEAVRAMRADAAALVLADADGPMSDQLIASLLGGTSPLAVDLDEEDEL
ncbi:hypothetical protein [Nocardiopsis composta]|uniref:Uncharacterized protein n=1 Tax=Nocardiopsis composta TaxID=157465 RepID=A0A7W8VCF9_9ACTN|nr:hypothetical protein [Nocardiopsis composta]MBB5431396.1 hypothetical protein [Nocardiopsis composta]